MDDFSRITSIINRLEGVTSRLEQLASVNLCSSCATAGSIRTIVPGKVAPTAKFETDDEESELLTANDPPSVWRSLKETIDELKFDRTSETLNNEEEFEINYFGDKGKFETGGDVKILTSKEASNVLPNSKETNGELNCDEKNETVQNGEEEIVSGFARNSIEFGVEVSEKLLQAMKEKETKLKMDEYANDLDALFDGAPIFDIYNECDVEDYEVCSLSKKKQQRVVFPRPYSPVATYVGATNITYLREYPRQIKPVRGLINVEIVNVISAREIYLRMVKQKECLEKHISPLLKVLSESADCEPLSSDLFLEYVACAFKDPVTNQWCRARLGPGTDIENAKIPVSLIDYGRQVWVDYQNRHNLKSLRAKGVVQNEAQLYKCRLRELSHLSPTEVESKLLRELLPVGSEFSCCFDRDRREPYKVELSDNADGKSIVEIFESEMEKRNLRQMSDYQRKIQRDIELYVPPRPGNHSETFLSEGGDSGDN